MIERPAPRPCISCPYRCDVPSGVWDETEYAKLPEYDGETWEQPPSLFLCHQQDGRMCAGWVGCHEMEDSFGLRMAVATGIVTPETYEATLDYTTDVPLFESGAAAAEHGRQEIEQPGDGAKRTIEKLRRRR